jgi:hypothetical protein
LEDEVRRPFLIASVVVVVVVVVDAVAVVELVKLAIVNSVSFLCSFFLSFFRST